MPVGPWRASWPLVTWASRESLENAPRSQRKSVAEYAERAANHPVPARDPELAKYFSTRDPPPQQLTIRTDDARRFLRRLAHQLDPKPSHPRALQRGNELGRALRGGMKDRVTTAHVRLDGV